MGCHPLSAAEGLHGALLQGKGERRRAGHPGRQQAHRAGVRAGGGPAAAGPAAQRLQAGAAGAPPPAATLLLVLMLQGFGDWRAAVLGCDLWRQCPARRCMGWLRCCAGSGPAWSWDTPTHGVSVQCPSSTLLRIASWVIVLDPRAVADLHERPTLGMQVTVEEVASLKRVGKGSTLLLLDRNGGQSKAVAKALARKGFRRAFVVSGGFKGASRRLAGYHTTPGGSSGAQPTSSTCHAWRAMQVIRCRSTDEWVATLGVLGRRLDGQQAAGQAQQQREPGGGAGPGRPQQCLRHRQPHRGRRREWPVPPCASMLTLPCSPAFDESASRLRRCRPRVRRGGSSAE